MNTVKNYILGNWEAGSGTEYTARHAITGAEFATVSSEGLDYKAILDYARNVGGPALRKMTFQERGRMLKALAKMRYFLMNLLETRIRLRKLPM